MSVFYLGIGARWVSVTSGSVQTFAYPTDYTATAGDLAVLVYNAWGASGGPTITVPSGYTSIAQAERNLSTDQNLICAAHYRLLNGGEAAPTYTVQSAYSTSATDTGSGFAANSKISGYLLIFRYASLVDPIGPTSTGFSAASTTYTAPAVTTTLDANCEMIALCSTGDANTISNTDGDYTIEYQATSTTGTDSAMAFARYTVRRPGVPTRCAWQQSTLGPDSWAVVSFVINSTNTGFGINAKIV